MPREGSLLASRLADKEKKSKKEKASTIAAVESASPKKRAAPDAVEEGDTDDHQLIAPSTKKSKAAAPSHDEDASHADAKESLSRGAAAWRAAKKAREDKLAGKAIMAEQAETRGRVASAQEEGRRLFVGGISTKECGEDEASSRDPPHARARL
jgi:hypothetical protein